MDQRIELIAALSALIAVSLTAWGRKECWLWAILSSTLYGYVFWRAGFIGQSVLQLLFIGMAIYGYISWRSVEGEAPFRTQTLPPTQHLSILKLCAVLSFGIFAAMGAYSIAVLLDIAMTVLSIAATVLSIKRVTESWIYWMGIDLVLGALFLYQSLYPTGIVYGIYLLVAAQGFQKWRQFQFISEEE